MKIFDYSKLAYSVAKGKLVKLKNGLCIPQPTISNDCPNIKIGTYLGELPADGKTYPRISGAQNPAKGYKKYKISVPENCDPFIGIYVFGSENEAESGSDPWITIPFVQGTYEYEVALPFFEIYQQDTYYFRSYNSNSGEGEQLLMGNATKFSIQSCSDNPEPVVELPANTLRLKFEPLHDWTDEGELTYCINEILNKGTSYTVVDEANHIYDWTRNNSDWSSVFAFYAEWDIIKISILKAGDTSGVTNMENMFNATHFGSITLFDTSNVTNAARMFENFICEQGTFPDFDFSSVENADSMFGYLNTYNIPILNFYNKLSTNGKVTTHVDTFKDQPSSKYSEQLAQIPTSWGGNLSE